MENPELAAILGKNIVSRRKELGISQKEMAKKLDITIDSMMKMEKGRMAPKLSRLQEIADTLNCSVSSLFHTQSELTDEKIREIAEALSKLPSEKQEAVLKIMYTSIGAFNKEN